MDPHRLTFKQITVLRQALQKPRYELVPIAGATEQIGLLPPGSSVAITASPRHGMGPTLDLAVALKDSGHHPVPHIAARSISTEAELAEIHDTLRAAGIEEQFVVAGDRRDPAGPYPDGLELLRAMETSGMLPERIGAPGYPEGHHFITERALEEILQEKTRYLSYLTSQMCFSPVAIEGWLGHLRVTVPDLPVRIGIPGVVAITRLAAIGGRIGVGRSLRFLKTTKGLVGQLADGGFDPGDLVTGMAPLLDDRVLGFHIYTFNQVRRTEEWRLQLLELLTNRIDTG